jgi:hypothetical protein
MLLDHVLPDVVCAENLLPVLVVRSSLPLPPAGSVITIAIALVFIFAAPAFAKATNTGFNVATVLISSRHSQSKLGVILVFVWIGALLGSLRRHACRKLQWQ